MGIVRRVSRRYLTKTSATIELPDTFPPSEIGLMTKEEFLNFRNPQNKFHFSEAYTFSLDSLNRDPTYGVGSAKDSDSRRGDFLIEKGDNGYLFYQDDSLVGVLHRGVLYHSDRNLHRNFPEVYWLGGKHTYLPLIKKMKLVKYLSEVLPLVSDDTQLRLKMYPYIYQRVKIKGEPFTVRFEEKPGLDQRTNMAVFNEEGKIVAVAQNEWGATLLGVADEYRGRGLGKYIGNVWYKLNPNSESGGFTQSGKSNALSIWNNRVREFLSRGWYSNLVQEGRLSKNRLKIILSDLDSRGSSSSRLPDDFQGSPKQQPKRLLLHIDFPVFILYDQEFLEVSDLYDNDLSQYIYGYGFFRGSGDKSYLYRVDYERAYRELIINVALQMARDEGFSIYDGEGYSDILELDGVDHVQRDGDYVNLTKDILPLNRLSSREKRIRRKYDMYDEKKNFLYELADSKW